MPCSRTSQGEPSSRRPTGRALRSTCPAIAMAGDDGGEGVAADELQHQVAGPGGADPAQHRAEPVRQVLRPSGEVGDRLAGDDGDLYPVGEPGRGHLAEHGHQQLSAVDRGQAGDGQHGQPVALIIATAPLAPGRVGEEPGERHRPEPPPGGQQRGRGGDEDNRAGPPSQAPRPAQHGGGQVQQRMPGQELDQTMEPGQLDEGDDPPGGVVDWRPPDRRGERVRVIDLGQLLAGEPRHLHHATSASAGVTQSW